MHAVSDACSNACSYASYAVSYAVSFTGDHYCGDHPHKRANAAFLACCVCVCVLKQTAEEAFAPFLGCDPPLHPFRDAGFGVCTFQCLVLDCVRGVAKACALKHYDYAQFDVDARDISRAVRGRYDTG